MSQTKKEKTLQGRVEGLIRENKTLKKKLSKLRKLAHTSVNYSKPKPDPSIPAKPKEPKECDYCRGEIRYISVYNLKFEVCQKCKTRVRVK